MPRKTKIQIWKNPITDEYFITLTTQALYLHKNTALIGKYTNLLKEHLKTNNWQIILEN